MEEYQASLSTSISISWSVSPGDYFGIKEGESVENERWWSRAEQGFSDEEKRNGRKYAFLNFYQSYWLHVVQRAPRVF